jgi:hypothetical protein
MSNSPIAALAAHHQPRPRLPFTDARQGNNIPTQSQPRTKVQPAPEAEQHREKRPHQNQKQLPEPKKDKARPPSPPAIIRDQKETLVFSKVGFLGEVNRVCCAGFCYDLNTATGGICSCLRGQGCEGRPTCHQGDKQGSTQNYEEPNQGKCSSIPLQFLCSPQFDCPSYSQKSRSTSRFTIQTSLTLRNALRTKRMFTWF